jgi:hypothetical protein
MRLALSLGAGDIVGAAWMIGALDALEQRGGLAPAQASEILGTSVGSQPATMLAAGIPTQAMAADVSGESDGALEPLAEHDATAFRLARLPLSLRPGSLSMALRARDGAGRLTGLLARGVLSTGAIASLIAARSARSGPRAPCASSPVNTRAASASSSEPAALPTARPPRRSPRRVPSLASMRQSRSTDANSSTVAFTRTRTSTCWPPRSSTR